jgi:hypothetical protein
MTNNWQGFRAEELFMSPEGAHPHHPSELGHSYMADLAVGLLQQTYLELMLQPLTQEGEGSFPDHVQLLLQVLPGCAMGC